MSKILKNKPCIIKEKLKKKKQEENNEVELALKKLGIKTKKIPENLSNVDVEFSFFLKIKK